MNFALVFEFWPLLLQGLLVTLALSATAIVGGMILGVVAGVGLTSRQRWIRIPVMVYTAIFRGSPLLVQLFFIYLGLAYLGIDLPVFLAASIGFILYAGAYIAEIVRAGIEAIPGGQLEAASSLGLTGTQTMMRVILPPALRQSVPALTSFNLSLIKDSSLASIIGFVDLMKEGQTIIALTGKPFETYLVIAAVYFCICFPISWLVSRLERKDALS